MDDEEEQGAIFNNKFGTRLTAVPRRGRLFYAYKMTERLLGKALLVCGR